MVVGIAALADGFGRCGIGMNHIGQLAEAHSALHGHGDLADHVACVVAHDGRPRDLIRALLYVDLEKPLGGAVHNAAIDVGKFARKGF